MKPSTEQIKIIEIFESIVGYWKRTNDINSPTLIKDMREILEETEFRTEQNKDSAFTALWKLLSIVKTQKQ